MCIGNLGGFPYSGIPQVQTQLNGAELIYLRLQSNAAVYMATIDTLASFIGQNLPQSTTNIQYSAPAANNYTVECASSGQTQWVVITPTSSLSGGTIRLPSASYALGSQEVTITSYGYALTSLTFVSTGATFVAAPTSISANASVTFKYEPVLKRWYVV